MKKVYKLQDLDCANCAAKMETAINRIDGVNKATISFMTQKLTIEAEDNVHESILEEAKKAIKKVEPGCVILA